MRKVLLLLIVPFLLAGCGSIYNQDAVGVGYDASELKVSPCACLEVKNLNFLPV
jgi:uncharacterized protein YceK